jgi:hypothetical protein
MEEHLPSKYEALSSNPTIAKKPKKQKTLVKEIVKHRVGWVKRGHWHKILFKDLWHTTQLLRSLER